MQRCRTRCSRWEWTLLMLVVCLTGSWRPVHADNGNHFWEWGVGQYQETHGDITLDDARWDWLVVGWINNGLATQAAWDHINACLAMNPNLKLVIELDLQWCEFGNPERYAGAATMFDYYFDSQYHDHQSAKTGIEQTLHRSYRVRDVEMCISEADRWACACRRDARELGVWRSNRLGRQAGGNAGNSDGISNTD